MIEQEKKLEAKLRDDVKALGGWSIKLLSTFVKGLPDRLCLFPGGRVAFAEMKGTGKKPTAAQNLIHRKLRNLGFEVVVLDSSTGIDEFLERFKV